MDGAATSSTAVAEPSRHAVKASLRQVLNAALDNRDPTVAVVVIKESGIRLWNRPSPGLRVDWLSRRLADAWEVLTGEKR